MTGAEGNRRWFSRRAVALHLALLVALPLCGIAAWWQVERALSGNVLSWLYVVEWPAFGGIAVWLWWVLLTTRGAAAVPAPRPGDRAESLLAVRAAPLRWDDDDEPAPLKAYNSYLTELNAGRKASRPRAPRPWPLRRSAMIESGVQAS